MAFAHFHRHKNKYMVFAFVAMVFSLLSFSITRALTDMAANAFGHSSARLTFHSSSGKLVEVEDEFLALAQHELPGACEVFAQVGGLDPYVGMSDGERAYAHAILLAEAQELGIAAPSAQVGSMLDRFKHFVQQMVPDRPLTVDDFARLLARRRLTEAALAVRLGELIEVEAYVRAMKGAPVASPARLLQLATPRATKVGLEAVALDFAKFKADLQAAPPADADLETWFKALATDVIEEKYTRGERLALDFVLVDVAAWDPASVAAELVPAVELTDEEVLAEAKRDALRYFGDRAKAPAALADVTDEARAKIRKDRQLKAVLEKLRADFDAAVAALPAPEPPAAPPAEGDDAAKEAAAKAAQEKAEQQKSERIAAESAEFAKVVARYGFAVKNVVDQEAAELAKLDPPKDPSLRFLVTGLSEPGAAGGRSHSVLPTGERTHAYVVRKSAPTKPAEAKPFAEVKEQALAQWIEEHAKEAAIAKGDELIALLLAEAEKALPADVLAALVADRDAGLKIIADDLTLDADAKKARNDQLKRIHAGHVFGAAGPAATARFGELAKQLGLEVKAFAPQRRDVASSWYYNDRFSGAERFLFRQNRFASDGSSEAMLLALGEGAIHPQVLVDDPSGVAYVARVASRALPTADDLTARDRQQAERDLKSEWNEFDNPYFRMQRGGAATLPVCENPFAMAQICRRHHPMVRVSEGAAHAAPQGYGYGY